MIEEVVIQPDIHPLLGRIRGRMGRCLCGEHKYAESLINRNLDRQKEVLPPTISIRVQYETIDVCVTAARNELCKIPDAAFRQVLPEIGQRGSALPNLCPVLDRAMGYSLREMNLGYRH